MNSISDKVILKKVNRLNNVNKHTYKLIIDICNGVTQIRPVYKVPDKLTVIDTFDELIKILFILKINFVVTNTAIKGGKIGTLITIKTHVKNGINTTKTRKA